MENNLENKAKFFSLYYGQKVYRHNAWNTCRESIEVHGSSISNCAFGYLELKNIKYLSKEDYKYIVQNNIMNPSPWESVDVTFGKIGGLDLSDVTTIDFLRSKGYVLPFIGITVETLIEYGWVKFKGNA